MVDDPDGDARDGTDPAAEGSPRVQNPFSRTDSTDEDRDSVDGHEAGDASERAEMNDVGDEARDRRRDAPLDELARRVGERTRDRDARDDRDPFEAVNVGDIDSDELWESLDAGGTDRSDADDLGQYDPPETAAQRVEATTTRDTRPEHVLDKREYCQRCPYLSAPPEVSCGHDGTEIVEVVDGERFRVRGCPMVTTDGKPNFAAVDDADSDTAATGTAVATAADETTEAAGADPPAGSSSPDDA